MDEQPTNSLANSLTSSLPTTEELTETAKKLNEQVATLYQKSIDEIRANPWRYATIAGGLAVSLAALYGGIWYKRR